MIQALHEAVDDQANRDRFHGYMPECGDPSLRETIDLANYVLDSGSEVDRVTRTVARLSAAGIRSGVNLMVSASAVDDARRVYARLRRTLGADQIILVPQRFSDTPTPRQLASVAGGQPFQSPDCILGCRRPERFCSVSWDKKANSCSFAGGRQRLATLDFKGLTDALARVDFAGCG